MSGSLAATCVYECEQTGGCVAKYSGPPRSGNTIVNTNLEYHFRKQNLSSKHHHLSPESVIRNQTKLSMFLQQVISYMIGPGSDVQNIWLGL